MNFVYISRNKKHCILQGENLLGDTVYVTARSATEEANEMSFAFWIFDLKSFYEIESVIEYLIKCNRISKTEGIVILDKFGNGENT